MECDYPGCDFKTDSKRGLGVHKATHKEDSPKKEYECEYCGETFEDYPSRREGRGREKFFCDNECKNLYAGRNSMTVDCSWCGEDVDVSPSQQDSMGDYSLDNHFCDKSCEKKFKKENWVGENHPSWDGGKVEIKCEICEDPRKVKPSEVEEARFCSRSCKREARRVDKETRSCANCGGDVTRKPYNFKTEDVTCSNKCLKEHMKNIRKGENNPAWKGGRCNYYGPNWKEAREVAIDSEGDKCVRCGTTREEHINTRGQDLHVHHIIPRRKFIDDSGNFDFITANSSDNLIPLCHGCHRVWEDIEIRPLPKDYEYSSSLSPRAV